VTSDERRTGGEMELIDPNEVRTVRQADKISLFDLSEAQALNSTSLE
jgi:hypothetical protein